MNIIIEQILVATTNIIGCAMLITLWVGPGITRWFKR